MSDSPHAPFVIGTRGSKLALAQTELVRAHIATLRPNLEVQIVRITTTGDRIQDRPLAQVGGKALFVTEIEMALREGRIHLAVHSAKDIPSDLSDDMCIAACLPRQDVRDVLISHVAKDIASLPPGARVGTSSPRRASQLRALRGDLNLCDIRGNVDTRIAKLDHGDFDAIVLAAAGLNRLGLSHRATQFVPIDQMLPCAGQGAIALEVLLSNAFAMQLATELNHDPTRIAVSAERSFALAIGGNCDTPLAAHAVLDGDIVSLSAMIGDATGKHITASLLDSTSNAIALGSTLAHQMLAHGGAELLRSVSPSAEHVA